MARFFTWLTAGLALLLALVYRFRRLLLARWLRLPPPRVRGVGVERNLRVPMEDGVTLAADWYRPVSGEGPGPTILIRTPYNKRDPLLVVFAAQRFAERGYHVLVQDARGQFDSEGAFEPLGNEAVDGAATLRWLADQPWCNGRIGMWGPSYVGYVQWAAAAAAPERLTALMPMVTGSQMKSVILPDGVLAFDLHVRWHYLLQLMDNIRHPWEFLTAMRPDRLEQDLAAAFRHLPAREAIDQLPVAVTPKNRPAEAFSDLGHPFWSAVDHRAAVGRADLPVHLVGGWYDIFAREMLADYRRLFEAGRRPYLTMGPWAHTSFGLTGEALRQGIEWFDTHLADMEERAGRKPVRIYVMGAETWRELDEWPPAARETAYFLQPAGGLGLQAPDAAASSSRFRYDPADPPPSLGGPMLTMPSGPLDNRLLEAREDILLFSSEPLQTPLTVAGSVRLRLVVRSTVAHTDFTGRLCDVHPDGRSVNICDGLFRIAPGANEPQADGSLAIIIDLWVTAHCFLPGHRLRLQVSSAMHPRYLRHLNTAEDPMRATSFMVAEQTVFHDRDRPSALLLPVVDAWPGE